MSFFRIRTAAWHPRRLLALNALATLTIAVGLAGCQSMVPGPWPAGQVQLDTAEAAVHAPSAPSAAPAAVSRPVLWDVALATDVPAKTLDGHATPALPRDLWTRLRLGMRIPEPGGTAAERVAQHERWYRQNATHLRRTFARARLYLYDIVEAVEREGMPLEIALLPAVESAFVPEAHSSAAAVGLWQFIAPTGRRFNLKQHMFQDDRRNVRAATLAALRYLNELQRRYGGDYQLALAAYNCGEGCIDAAVQRARAQGLPGRFEDLRLNGETANYVPKLMALTRVVTQAVDRDDLESASLPPMANAPYFAVVPIRRDIDVKLAGELAGLSPAEFKALNPQHKKPVIVAAANTEVLVPVEREARFNEALFNYRGPLASWGTAKVDRRISVDALARQLGTPSEVLREVNQIPPGHLVMAGSTLVIPRKDHVHDISADTAAAATLATMPAMVSHRVQVLRKETWASLATRLGTSPADLKGWNPQLRALRRGIMALTLPIAVAERAATLPYFDQEPTRRGGGGASARRQVKPLGERGKHGESAAVRRPKASAVQARRGVR